MASKGPKSKLDHETRARRQKALEPPKEPRRPKTHWDHVLEEMVWLSKDFESERKWKLAQAKKVAIRASKGMVDQATRGERKVKEEELRMRKVALNISKDVKKFWIKIEKLVLYKHQLELDVKKKKVLDKQLEFLLGQTERYSTMLAENLVDAPGPSKPRQPSSALEQLTIQKIDEDNASKCPEPEIESESNIIENDEDYAVQSEDEPEDDEHTIEEDEALITEQERQEELEALQNEIDLPLEELLKRYTDGKASRESSPERNVDVAEPSKGLRDDSQQTENGVSSDLQIVRHSSPTVLGHRSVESNGGLPVSENQAHQTRNSEKGFQGLRKKQLQYDFQDENEDGDFILANGEEKDDEATLSEEEELAKEENNEAIDEIALLQNESSIPIEELLARYRKNSSTGMDSDDDYESECGSESDNSLDSPAHDSEAKLHDEGEVASEIHELSGSLTGKQEEKQDQILEEGENNEDRIADAAAAAKSAQPTGNTFLTTKVRTQFPFLLKFSLREYQHIGLDWLVTMYEKRLNGILADEMGLGKTIMTIALLAHLACEKGIWGPHLIVVPTSVMLNWETEFLKWCPAFKILTYFGSAKERKIKRQGWLKPNYFHVCITTYRLVIQDSKIFKRKKWKYLILDEAHLIKNWKSQRWQTLLNFNTKRRILLTGTPLQNDLMELWSLMHFLMPHIFQSHQEFKDWFSNPITGMVEGQEKVNKEVVDRLHNVLRPFILRRLKRDVEKQLPSKHEHVIYCRLSRRQRNLYEDFIASSETQATLSSGSFFGMIGVIMQLRKVCNHPDLFEGRPIISSFDMNGIDLQLSSYACSMLMPTPFSTVDLSGLGFLFSHLDFSMTSWESEEVQSIATPSSLIESRADLLNLEDFGGIKFANKSEGFNIFEEIQKALFEERLKEAKERAASIAWWNSLRCKKKPMYSTSLRDLVTVNCSISVDSNDIVLSPIKRFQKMADQIESFMFAIPAARAPQPTCWCSKPRTSVFMDQTFKERCSVLLSPLLTPIRPAIVRRQVYFPDRRLIQFDCGKLQELAVLLRRLKSEGHRALIFTQMTKMLDVLEAFISLYGYTYMRLDGSTQPEERQTLMQRFNTNPKYFLFILSTRSGGVGINLVGADTVIFYDSDWNPAMDQQAQDRCHRIGQTREVHIYRLISESTIEENILRKAKQKRALDDLVIQSGEYNTEFFKKLDPIELFSGHEKVAINNPQKEKTGVSGVEASVSNADVEAALKHAEDEADYMALKKVEEEEAVDNQEFTEEARVEDDELVNDEDMKGDEPIDHGGLVAASVEENVQIINGSEPNEERAITIIDKEDDVEMLDDVKQMAAAAAAAGQSIVSFESQLRPIDRYAVRFLELWDPIIDKAAKESQVRFEETEWELDHIEKLKDDMEAEIDDDEQPFVYESWDSEFATKVYREQVEALAQHQLMEDRENEAREKELAESDSMKNETIITPKPKSKKKSKKTKFKSLKKEALASEVKARNMGSPLTPMSLADEIDGYEMDPSTDIVSPQSSTFKKRKAVADGSEVKISKKSKKFKKTPELCSIFRDSDSPSKQHDESKDSKVFGNGLELVHKPLSRSKMGVKISITSMPVKRVLTLRPEKVKRKVSIWSKDYLPNPDSWLSSEDAILCAVVHEYGPHWSLVSDVLYGMTSGGFYRGIFRHPVHCCERFRELIQRYVLSSADNLNNDKSPNACPAKVLLKVTEDHVRMLLDVASEQPDQDPTIQRHFFALLSSVWRDTTRHNHQQNFSSFQMGRFLPSTMNHTSRDLEWQHSGKRKFTNLNMCAKVVAAVLDDAYNIQREERVSTFNQREEVPAVTDLLGITLEIPEESDDGIIQFPSVVDLSIHGSDALISTNEFGLKNDHLRSSQYVAENRFRDASRTCVEGYSGWASSAFQAGHINSRTPSKSQVLGKHKLPISDSLLSTPSKSKVRKTTMHPGDTCSLPFDLNTQSTATMPSPRLDMEESPIPEIETDGIVGTSSLNINNEFDLGIDGFDVIPHNYDSDIITGLEECSLLSDFIDIG